MLPIIITRWTFRENRDLSAFTGCNYKKFAKLLPVFILILSQKRKSDSAHKRKVGGGRTNSLSCSTEQLIFILTILSATLLLVP